MGNIIIPQLALPKLPLGMPLNPFQETAKGLVFWWRGIPGRKVFDESGHGNHGMINGPTWVGDGLSFDGVGDEVNIGINSLFDITGPITVIAIVSTQETDGNNRRIISKGETGLNRAWLLSYDAVDDTVQFGDAEGFVKHTGFGLNDGQSHFIGCTYDGSGSASGYRIYIDGVNRNVTEVGTANGFEISSEPLLIGADSNDGVPSTSARWTGIISATTVYNRALSASEILALYINPNLPMAQDPIWLRYSPAEVSAGMAGIYYRTLLQGVN